MMYLPNGGENMITISLIIGFFGMLFGLVAAIFYGIVVAAGAVLAGLFGMLVKGIEKSESKNG